MSMKKSDLDKHARQEDRWPDEGRRHAGPFRAGRGRRADRREQRRLDAAAGLVPFACKLPAELAARLREKSAGHDGGLNGLVAELLRKALKLSGMRARRA